MTARVLPTLSGELVVLRAGPLVPAVLAGIKRNLRKDFEIATETDVIQSDDARDTYSGAMVGETEQEFGDREMTGAGVGSTEPATSGEAGSAGVGAEKGEH